MTSSRGNRFVTEFAGPGLRQVSVSTLPAANGFQFQYEWRYSKVDCYKVSAD